MMLHSTGTGWLVGGKYAADMTNLKVRSMDPALEEHYKERLRQWKKDEDSFKEKLEEMDGMWALYMK